MNSVAQEHRHVFDSQFPGLACRFFQQIMFAVDYCHKMGVANRDIKLENTLLRDTSSRPLVKLADFGFSKDENCHSAPGSCVGTPAYLAPEVLSTQHGQSYNAKASFRRMGWIRLPPVAGLGLAEATSADAKDAGAVKWLFA